MRTSAIHKIETERTLTIGPHAHDIFRRCFSNRTYANTNKKDHMNPYTQLNPQRILPSLPSFGESEGKKCTRIITDDASNDADGVHNKTAFRTNSISAKKDTNPMYNFSSFCIQNNAIHRICEIIWPVDYIRVELPPPIGT